MRASPLWRPGPHEPAPSHKSSLWSTCREDERSTTEGMMSHLGLQPGETVSILGELARLVETRWWENTSSQFKSPRLVCTQKNNEVSCVKLPFIIQPLKVTPLSLVRTRQHSGLILGKASKSDNWGGSIWMLIYYTG